jgi:uncharacterized protein YraI
MRLGLGRLLLVPVAAATLTAALMAPAAAAAAPGVTPASAVIETTHADVTVHRLPDIYSTRLSTIVASGTRITINCWAHGSVVDRNILWYHITSPVAHQGYVAAALTSAPTRVPDTVTRCPLWERTYRTTGGDVFVRTGPGTQHPMIHRIERAGTDVTIICWAQGTPFRNEGWYLILSPFDGYVAGAYLNTPQTRVPGSPDC